MKETANSKSENRGYERTQSTKAASSSARISIRKENMLMGEFLFGLSKAIDSELMAMHQIRRIVLGAKKEEYIYLRNCQT
jgi:hypothetical protein